MCKKRVVSYGAYPLFFGAALSFSSSDVELAGEQHVPGPFRHPIWHCVALVPAILGNPKSDPRSDDRQARMPPELGGSRFLTRTLVFPQRFLDHADFPHKDLGVGGRGLGTTCQCEHVSAVP